LLERKKQFKKIKQEEETDIKKGKNPYLTPGIKGPKDPKLKMLNYLTYFSVTFTD